MEKSILHNSFCRIVNALNDIASDVIVWPKGDRLIATKNKFNEIGVLPDIIGAIGGSHILILAPHVNLFHFSAILIIFFFLITQFILFSCFCLFSFNLSHIEPENANMPRLCDADLVFTDCFVGFPGSVNDYRIFRNSDLWMSIQENRIDFFPGNEYIIANKVYPVLSWCIPPYINKGNLSQVSLVNFLFLSFTLASTKQLLCSYVFSYIFICTGSSQIQQRIVKN